MGNDFSTPDNRPESLEDCMKDGQLDLLMCADYWDREMEERTAYLKRRYQDVVNTLIRMTNPSLGSRLLAASYAHLGWTSEAKFWAQRVLRYQPDFTISDWIEKLPETDRAENEHFADGLRKSGLPD